MLILHATAKERDLLFWAEAAPAVGVMPVAATGKAKPRSHQSLPAKSLPTKSLPHPFAAPAADLIEAMETVGFTVDADNYSTLQATIWLPTADSAPLASSPLIAPNESANSPAAASSLSPWQLAALRLPMATLVELLTLSSGKSLLAPGLLLGADLSFWTMALRFAAALVTRQQFLPVLDKNDVNNSYGAWWQPVFTGMDTERLMKLTRAMPHSCRALSDGVKEPPRLASEEVLAHFLGAVVDYLVRVSPNPPLAVLPKRAGPVARPSLAPSRARPVFDSVHDEWLYALTAADNQMVGDPTDLAQLSAQVKEWQRAVTITTATPWRLCFRLEEPPAPAAEIREDEDSADIEVLNKRHSRHGASMATDEPEINQSWQVRYLLQACDDPSLLIPTENAWQSQEGLSRALRSKALSQDLGWKPARVREYLLAALGQAASLCPGVEDSLKSSAPGGYTLDDTQAHAFLTQHAWLLEQAGFGVFLPAWWTRKGTKLQLTTRANVKSPKMQGGNGLSLEEIIKFEWQVALGGETLTLRELEALARLKSPLVRFRGQWVQLSAEEIQAALNFWKERSTTRASVRELLRMAIGADAGASALAIEGVQASGWVGDLLSQLQGHVAFEEAPQPKELQGQLRPYQV
ncbi:MAG: SNF2 helicase-associated domain-containing protein, partial [Abitibacteriaceae bacterium]|nr:SNF2 helicase-associated domain-containing protein [Abditibacteriaceae bacterium]